MPRAKKERKSAARRSPRVASPARQSKTKKLNATRELSERRPQRSVQNKKTKRRLSVAPQAGKRQAASLSASVYDLKGKAVGRVSLPSEIFGVADNPKLISQAVRVYLANQRRGTVSTKTRGEVEGSTRKIRPQKGSGHARHGGIRAPIFVHGGIAHGPKPRDFSASLPHKMRRLALFSSLSGKLTDGEIKFLEVGKLAPKTKIMAKALQALNLDGKILLVTPGGSKNFENIYKASRNIEGVKILPAPVLNTYDVLDNSVILFIRDSLEVLKKHFLKGAKE